MISLRSSVASRQPNASDGGGSDNFFGGGDGGGIGSTEFEAKSAANVVNVANIAVVAVEKRPFLSHLQRLHTPPPTPPQNTGRGVKQIILLIIVRELMREGVTFWKNIL